MTDAMASPNAATSAPALTLDRAQGAFLGAAIGDALGWPHEMRATRAGKFQRFDMLAFERWTKRSGGRFQPHEELIESGHYSDDTQLILAISRSILRAPTNWWVAFACEELPLWTLYQRGGGGATKRAATSWLSGKAPWTAKPADAERYFSAGGNGVAMRVLPHCLRHAGQVEFNELATDIMTDGVTTHGHPRAIVGALAYGYGLWQAFRHRGTLDYGVLLSAVLTGWEVWGKFPNLAGRWTDWQDAASLDDEYERLWTRTVREQLNLLEICADALAGGAAVIDEDTLKTLGCFDRSVNGSGTVNAAAAIFLASRHAAEPIRGVAHAALAEGADTDTLASMVGGLLGAAVGLEWTRDFTRDLQDAGAIRHFADAIHTLGDGGVSDAPLTPVTKASLAAFLGGLRGIHEPVTVTLPNGMTARAQKWDGVISKSRSLLASAWKLELKDGQTLYVKKLAKIAAEAANTTGVRHDTTPPSSENVAAPLHLGFRLVVSNLARSTVFYQEVVGLPISKRTAKSVNLGGVLSIGEADRSLKVADGITVFIEVRDIAHSRSVYERLLPDRNLWVEEREDRIRLQCHDPDGYKIELYQMKESESVT